MNDVKKYMLISVYDREILSEIFHSERSAIAEMKAEMIQEGSVPDSFFTEAHSKEEGNQYGYSREGGYSNVSKFHSTCDWSIVEL